MKKQKCKCYCHKDMNTVVTAWECTNKDCENDKPSEKKEQSGWEERFDALYDFDQPFMKKYQVGLELLTEDIKSFIADLLRREREKTKQLLLEGKEV